MFEWLKTNIVAFISIVISIVALVESRRPFSERKIMVYQKLRVLRSTLERFQKSLVGPQPEAVTKAPRGYVFRFPGDAWDKFGITKEEEIEFALLDSNLEGMTHKYVGLPERLRSYLTQTADYDDSREEYYVTIREQDLGRKNVFLIILLEDVQSAMTQLKREMPLHVRYRSRLFKPNQAK